MTCDLPCASPTSFLLSNLGTHSNFIQHQAVSSPTSTFFDCFAGPPDVPTQATWIDDNLYGKNLRTKNSHKV